jgi:hypothetical protein
MRSRHRTAPSVAVVSLAVAAVAWSQAGEELPRRAALGVALAVRDDGAIVVSSMSETSSAAAAGVRVGDVIAALDGTPITAMSQVQSIVGAHRGGDVLTIDVERDAIRSRLSAALRPFPSERLPNTTFTYGHVTLENGVRLRTIVSTPTNAPGRAPAVLVLQGGGCSSVDVPQAGSAGPNAFIHAVAAAGFVTMRVDKPGAGDSEGPPCPEIGFPRGARRLSRGAAGARRAFCCRSRQSFPVRFFAGWIFRADPRARSQDCRDQRVRNDRIHADPISRPERALLP